MSNITHNSRHRFVLSLLKLKKEEELKKKEEGNVRSRRTFLFYVCEFLFEFFFFTIVASRIVRRARLFFLFVPLFVSVCRLEETQRKGGAEKKNPTKVYRQETERMQQMFVFVCLFFITWWRRCSEWEEHDMAGDTNVAVRRGFTVQRVHRTQCRLVCTRRDLGGWAGPVGQVGAGPVGGWGWWSIRCLDTSARPQVESQ